MPFVEYAMQQEHCCTLGRDRGVDQTYFQVVNQMIGGIHGSELSGVL